MWDLKQGEERNTGWVWSLLSQDEWNGVDVGLRSWPLDFLNPILLDFSDSTRLWVFLSR